VEIQASGLGHIRQVSSDERMHPVEDPREEARKLYVESSGLLSRIESASEDEPLCIWDVGLGAATNAMAAIRAWEQSPRARLTIISFERDLDPMRLATDHPFAFPHVKHAGPYLLLEQGKYVSKCGRLEWRLVQGDFATACADEPTRPDFVFYDPFSAKTDDAPLWSPEFFERLHGLWAGKPAIIVSYSNSTAVRATWLAAGFYVASGAPSARRRDTSLILTPASAATLPEGTPLLGRAWLDRWERSSAPAPASVLGASGAVREAFLARVRSHPQFRPS
jgi:queuine tRNA-ribosyltransferase